MKTEDFKEKPDIGKIPYNKIVTFFESFRKYKEKHPEHKVGWNVMLALKDVSPEIFEKVYGSEYDPIYGPNSNDANHDEVLTKMMQKILG